MQPRAASYEKLPVALTSSRAKRSGVWRSR